MSQTVTTNADEDKAVPDDGTLGSDFELTANDKVQLDIDDAPFLHDPEEESPPPALALERAVTTRDEPKTGRSKKKLLAVVIILALVVVGIGSALTLFMLKKTTPPPPGGTADTPPVVVVPSAPPPPPLPAEYNLKLAPFWVPVKTQTNEERFLVGTFVLNTKDAVLNAEMEDKLPTLRDAIYYYLRNKDFTFLIDSANAETIRTELIEAINHYLIQGELKNLYFDQYLLQ